MLMVQKGFITDADNALANFVWNNIKTESTVKNIISSQDQISFSYPKSNQGTRKLSIFLYSITEEMTSKNMSSSANDSEKNTNNLSLVLHYLITPFTRNDKDDHALLEKITSTVLATPLISTTDNTNNVELKMKIDSLSINELTKLWIALGTSLKLSLSLAISSSEPPYDSQKDAMRANATPQTLATDTRNINQLYNAVSQTFTEQSTGWMNRNMLIKQWVLQEFKKNTGMTVEEMLIALNHLGDKIEQNQSTLQFIEPLNLLTGYYQHQLDELKGLQKLSHKQTENLETITMWIRDIKTLVEILGR
jgi:Pvc16 N-terminal domain